MVYAKARDQISKEICLYQYQPPVALKHRLFEAFNYKEGNRML